MLFILPIISNAQSSVSIVPLPANMETSKGSFIIDKNTTLVYNTGNKDLRALAVYFNAYIEKISGIQLNHNPRIKNARPITLIIRQNDSLGKEGYALEVLANLINIYAAESAGIFYAMQTIMQTLPAIRTNEPLKVPFMKIKDTPRFPWRGFMLDVSRHFYGPEAIKEILDVMASFKMNVFHWHLCDNEGWRLEIKKYPKLTQKGAWRTEKQGAIFYNKDTSALVNKPSYIYGGYYTQEQVKDIIAYAALRNITVVPEIEMPGHSGAALSAYPQFSCTKLQVPVPNVVTSGYLDDAQSNYCPGYDSTFVFLQDVLTEVMDLFPSKYIHIGGDEVNKKDWKVCALCQALMKKENLQNEEALQSFFIKKIDKYIASKGRRIVGWGEILEGGLAPGATVMSWIGEQKGIEAAQLGHDVIMCPSNPLYLNRYQTDSIQYEPLAAKYSINTLEKVYSYEPVPQKLNEQHRKHILGSQAVIWTEFISTVEHLEYMLLPRLAALAEVVWSPKEKRNYASFRQRMKPRLKTFEQKGIRYFHKEWK